LRGTGNGFDDAVDPYLVLLDSAGNVVAFDDDSGAFTSQVTASDGSDLAGSNTDALITSFVDAG
jgi:hypothetical protein